MPSSWVVVFIIGFFLQECWSAQVEVERREILVLPGQNATFMCRVAVPLQYCRAVLPSGETFNLNKKLSNDKISYYGNGLSAGQCGFTINRVEERHNGRVNCTIGLETEAQESVGSMHLVVARAPKIPEIDLSRGTDSLNVYKTNDLLQASCIVRDGRPVANISWYLDEQMLYGEELSMPTVIDLAKENLQSKIQNMTRVLQPTDNGKRLRCIAYHPAYPEGRAESFRQLDVKYGPLAQDDPIDKFGYKLGQAGIISVEIEANPKPQIQWRVSDQIIKEGQVDNTGRLQAEAARDLSKGRYEVDLRIAAINKEDTEREYFLTAYNELGSQEYRIKISTSAEPEGIELGVGSIIGIVVALLVLLLAVFLLVFARVTGRWCFSGHADTRQLGECSDTESADVRPKDNRRNLSPIKLTAFFKKNKDKVSTEELPKSRHMETGEEIIQTEEQKPSEDPQEVKEGLVYAELDLVSQHLKPVVKNDDEKTEYAEIVYTPQDGNKGDKEQTTDKK